jgi:hypothetical protein
MAAVMTARRKLLLPPWPGFRTGTVWASDVKRIRGPGADQAEPLDTNSQISAACWTGHRPKLQPPRRAAKCDDGALVQRRLVKRERILGDVLIETVAGQVSEARIRGTADRSSDDRR